MLQCYSRHAKAGTALRHATSAGLSRAWLNKRSTFQRVPQHFQTCVYVVSSHEPGAKNSAKLRGGSAARNSSTLCTTGFGLGMTCKLKSWRRLGASFLLISSIWKSPVRTKQATRGCHNEVDELRSSWDRFVPMQTAGECLPEETKLQSPDTGQRPAQLCHWESWPRLPVVATTAVPSSPGNRALSSMSAAEKLALERRLPDGRSVGTSTRPSSASPSSPRISALRDIDRGRLTGSSGLGLGDSSPL